MNTKLRPPSSIQEAAPYLGMGLQLAAGVLVFYFIGKWADEQFNTSPWLMLGGVFIGVVGGLIKFVKSVNELTKKQSSNNQVERP